MKNECSHTLNHSGDEDWLVWQSAQAEQCTWDGQVPLTHRHLPWGSEGGKVHWHRGYCTVPRWLSLHSLVFQAGLDTIEISNWVFISASHENIWITSVPIFVSLFLESFDGCWCFHVAWMDWWTLQWSFNYVTLRLLNCANTIREMPKLKIWHWLVCVLECGW